MTELFTIILLIIVLAYIFKAPRASDLKVGTVIDTSTLIDGRLEKMIELNIIRLPLLIPSQVLSELEVFTNSKSTSYAKQRAASNHALKFLKHAQQIEHDDEYADQKADKQVVLLGLKHGYSVSSIDNEVIADARSRGLSVINPDQLYKGLRPRILKSDRLRVKLSYRAENKLTIAYTDYGEVVYVAKAQDSIGRFRQVEVTYVSLRGNSRRIEAKLAD